MPTTIIINGFFSKNFIGASIIQISLQNIPNESPFVKGDPASVIPKAHTKAAGGFLSVRQPGALRTPPEGGVQYACHRAVPGCNGNKQTMPTQDYIQAEPEKEMATRDELALQLADESDQGIIPQFHRPLKDIAVPTKVEEPEGEVSWKSGVNDPSTSADSAMSVKDVVFAEDMNSPNLSLEKSYPIKYNGESEGENAQEVQDNGRRKEVSHRIDAESPGKVGKEDAG